MWWSWEGFPQIIMRDPPWLTDSTPRSLPGEADEEGHVCVSGTCVTSGYEFRPHMDENPNINGFTPDGWLITGDKGYKDLDGDLFLVGRFKVGGSGCRVKSEIPSVLHPALSVIP